MVVVITNNMSFGGNLSKTGQSLLIGNCVICKKKSMTFNDKTLAAEGLGNFFETIGKKSAEAGKKTTNKNKRPRRASKAGAKSGSRAVSRNFKTTFSTIRKRFFTSL